MKTNHTYNDPGSSIFLTGTILLANVDYSGLADYALKAVIGGIIWMAFKVAGEYFSEKVKQK